MVMGIKYVTLTQIERAVITTSRKGEGYAATIVALGEPWTGETEPGVVDAVLSAFAAVKAEKRGPVRSRPTKRYQIAQSLLAKRRT